MVSLASVARRFEVPFTVIEGGRGQVTGILSETDQNSQPSYVFVQPRHVLRTPFPTALKAGMVWVNTYRAVSYMMPFGGIKNSGIGRESGMASVKEFLETKSVWISTSDAVPANPFIQR